MGGGTGLLTNPTRQLQANHTSQHPMKLRGFGLCLVGALMAGWLSGGVEPYQRCICIPPELGPNDSLPGLYPEEAIATQSDGLSPSPQFVSFQEGIRPSSAAHVPELATYLDQVQIGEPIWYRHLAVYPLFLERGVHLEGRWLTLDEAMRRGVLVVTEKDGGSVPVVWVENRSRDEYVFIMRGEILSGGKQTRTVRQDVILAPGQRVELDVFCVERGRWHGEEKFKPSYQMAPLAVKKRIAQGEGQQSIWESVRGLAGALQAATPSEDLAKALDAPHVRQDLDKVRKEIVPRIPARTMGFLFLQGRRPVGADMFGDAQIARELFPKLLDAYAVDCILLHKDIPGAERAGADREAIEFFKRIVRAGSQRARTPGSGAGIRTDALGLVGGGVSFGGTLVHYGVYVRHEPIVPLPGPKPMEGFRE
ncbi:MAG: hypothetical protein NZ602_07145 [Thermoguttaceae bacterium]|nr:hypothetical protein [Thermoguttaceae bacterium]MDW8037974.1 DUF6569 family protein [Thermoguttaceae bacterium]